MVGNFSYFCRLLTFSKIKFFKKYFRNAIIVSNGLDPNHGAMIKQICIIKQEDVATVRSSELLAKLELMDLDLILKEKASMVWDMWSGLMVQPEQQVWFVAFRPKSTAMVMAGRSVHLTRTACDTQVDSRGGDREAKAGIKEAAVSGSSPQLTIKKGAQSGARSALPAASQLPGRGPTNVDDAPAPAH